MFTSPLYHAKYIMQHIFSVNRQNHRKTACIKGLKNPSKIFRLFYKVGKIAIHKKTPKRFGGHTRRQTPILCGESLIVTSSPERPIKFHIFHIYAYYAYIFHFMHILCIINILYAFLSPVFCIPLCMPSSIPPYFLYILCILSSPSSPSSHPPTSQISHITYFANYITHPHSVLCYTHFMRIICITPISLHSYYPPHIHFTAPHLTSTDIWFTSSHLILPV